LEYLEIEGGLPLNGAVRLFGAKNSILPLIAASLLTNGRSVFTNVPDLSDVAIARQILTHLGGSCEADGKQLTVELPDAIGWEVPAGLMTKMRGSLCFLGSMLGRCGKAVIAEPGGCNLGERPIDLHIDNLSRMGAEFDLEEVVLEDAQTVMKDGRPEREKTTVIRACVPSGRLRGTRIDLRVPSVGATENLIEAAVTAKGTTVISGAACEPEISDLIDYLCDCGARITGRGTRLLTIEGVESLHGAQHAVVPDRILAATLIAAAGATGGQIVIENADEPSVEPLVKMFSQAGRRLLQLDGAHAESRGARNGPARPERDDRAPPRIPDRRGTAARGAPHESVGAQLPLRHAL